ncbi:MAG: hypothetical protein ABSG99_01110 [Sedimentisphaerales bacterium]
MNDLADQYDSDEQLLSADVAQHGTEGPSVMHYLLGAVVGALVMMGVYVAYPAIHHWAFFPLALNAIILFPVLFTWLIGKRDTFDPLGLACLQLVQFGVVSALLCLGTGIYGPLLIQPDAKDLLGQVAVIYLLTLVPFFLGYKIRLGESLGQRIFSKPKVVSFERLRLAIVIMIICSILARVYAVVRYGGVLGTTFERTQSFGTGKGVLLMIADTLCTALVLWFAYGIAVMRERGQLTSVVRTRILTKALVVVALIVLIVGLRGSRSIIVIYVLWVGGIYHFLVKRIKAVTVLAVFICFLPLLHGYAMYKSYGLKAIGAIFSAEERARFEKPQGPGLLGTVIGDLGRMNVWMYVKQEIDSGRYPLQFGRTYFAAALGVIPRAIWPTRPYGMSEVITDMRTGRGAYAAAFEKTSMVAGLIGESYANFDIFGPFLGMFFYGVILRALKTLMDRRSEDRLIAFLLPMIVYFVLAAFPADSDGVVYSVLKFLGPAVLAVWFSGVKTGAGQYGGEQIYSYSELGV